MTDWWRQLARREQLVLGGGAVLAGIMIVWSFIWLPLRDGASERNASVVDLSEQLVDLRRAAGLGGDGAAPSPVLAGAPGLLILADETGRSAGLPAFTRNNPDGNDATNISFQNTRFDRLIEWMIELEQIHSVAVVSASFVPGAGSGLVNGQLRLERS